ncbi:MAG: SDR family NAD(P)-dependent oxidoreductase, partial [Reyranella sp.]
MAVVTGAGAGLGRQHALELARRGAKVVVNDVAKDPDGTPVAEKTAAELRALGAEAIADATSVADEAAVQAMIERAVQAF